MSVIASFSFPPHATGTRNQTGGVIYNPTYRLQRQEDRINNAPTRFYVLAEYYRYENYIYPNHLFII